MRALGAADGVILAALVATLCFWPTAGQAFTTQWPQSTSDLKADPQVTFGTLPNGMRYAIRRNGAPTGEVSMRLVIEAGSLQERPEQAGLAHLLEHMAFRGSSNTPDGEVIKTLQRMGVRYGADANAATGPLDTTYRFDLATPESVDTGLRFLREIAGDLTLTQDGLDSERKVVLAEARQRESPQIAVNLAKLEAEFPGHPADRPTIGRTAVIDAATPAQLRAFYDAYYRPERAVVVVVGDVDPAAIETKIRSLFSDWRGRGPAGADPAPYAPTGRDATVVVDAAPGVTSTELSLMWVAAYQPDDESRAGRAEAIVRTIGERALSERIGQMREAAGFPFITGGAQRFQFAGVAQGETVSVRGVADVGPTVDVVTAAQRQLETQGLTQREVDSIVASARDELKREVAGSSANPFLTQSPAMASFMAQQAERGEIDLSPQQQLDLFETTVAGLTAARVNQVLRAQFVGEGPVIFLAADAPAPTDVPRLQALFASARSAPLPEYASPPVLPWTHTNFGPVGSVAERTEAADLGVTMARFANGVRLTVKPLKASAGQVQVVVRFGHGRLDQPKDRVDASDWSPILLQIGGLSDLRNSDVARSLKGHTATMYAGVDDEAFTLGTRGLFSQSVPTTDLDLELQYLAATMTSPGWRADAWNTLLISTAQEERGAAASPDQVFARNSAELLHPGDQRWVANTTRMRAGWTPAQARAFIEPIMKHSDIEIVVVGDVTPDQAIAAVAKTFGALPERKGLREPAGARDVRFPPPTAAPVELHHEGAADQAIAEISWPTTDRYSGWDDIAATAILADVLKQRVIDRLRTADGETYSPRGGADFSLIFPRWGRVSMLVPCKPEAVERVYAAIDAIAADLRDHPITDDELQRAVKPELQAVTRAQQQDGYWMGQLAGAQTDSRRLDFVRQALPRLSAVTTADVQRAAQTWLRPDRAFRIEVKPASSVVAAAGSGF
jgi:zinc protease